MTLCCSRVSGGEARGGAEARGGIKRFQRATWGVAVDALLQQSQAPLLRATKSQAAQPTSQSKVCAYSACSWVGWFARLRTLARSHAVRTVRLLDAAIGRCNLHDVCRPLLHVARVPTRSPRSHRGSRKYNCACHCLAGRTILWQCLGCPTQPCSSHIGNDLPRAEHRPTHHCNLQLCVCDVDPRLCAARVFFSAERLTTRCCIPGAAPRIALILNCCVLLGMENMLREVAGSRLLPHCVGAATSCRDSARVVLAA